MTKPNSHQPVPPRESPLSLTLRGGPEAPSESPTLDLSDPGRFVGNEESGSDFSLRDKKSRGV